MAAAAFAAVTALQQKMFGQDKEAVFEIIIAAFDELFFSYVLLILLFFRVCHLEPLNRDKARANLP